MVCINSGVIWLLGIRKLPKPIHQPCLHTLPSSRKQTTVVNPNKCKGKCVFNLFGLVGEKLVVVRRSKLWCLFKANKSRHNCYHSLTCGALVEALAKMTTFGNLESAFPPLWSRILLLSKIWVANYMRTRRHVIPINIRVFLQCFSFSAKWQTHFAHISFELSLANVSLLNCDF